MSVQSVRKCTPRPTPTYQCKYHGAFGVLPCAWPTCNAGVPEARIQVDAPGYSDDPVVFSRKTWQSRSGEPYYSWQQEDKPNWFGASSTFWSEASRQGLVVIDSREVVYHYTTLEGAFGILQSGTLWLSDYSYLNDQRELEHGTDLLQEVARELLLADSRLPAMDLLESWIRAIAHKSHRICVCSFSANPDSLDQWRSYGSIALGFRKNELEWHSSRAILRPVEYDRSRQRELLDLALRHYLQCYLDDLDCGRLDHIDAYHDTERFIELVAFFKDPAFRNEEEFRLAFIEDTPFLKAVGEHSAPKRFRVAGSKIVPFVQANELDSLAIEPPSLRISEVILGPSVSGLLERGLRELLDSKGLTRVRVVRSALPYRP
jgi:hypothetical protein